MFVVDFCPLWRLIIFCEEIGIMYRFGKKFKRSDTFFYRKGDRQRSTQTSHSVCTCINFIVEAGMG